jgi:Ice-binding-like
LRRQNFDAGFRMQPQPMLAARMYGDVLFRKTHKRSFLMKSFHKSISGCLLGVAVLLGGASAAFAAEEPNLGSASDFAVLSAAPGGGGAVTCTDSTITGNVGSSGGLAAVVQTSCTITGSIIAPVSQQVLDDFNSAYDALAAMPCPADPEHNLTGTLDGLFLEPGVYCIDSVAKAGTLTLTGSSTDTWIFLLKDGALTGTGFNVVMANGAEACTSNVYWSVNAAATMTTSQFVGTILAGAAITLTDTAMYGDALAKAAVTLTGSTVNGCGSVFNPPHQRCNQGVGNGPEGCDPGNSNQGNPFRSNDELGGTPGDPGRKGGNKK